jgi:hypothetical protein
MERRALRRAADQALLTSLTNPASSQAGGAPDQDFRYTDRDAERDLPSVETPEPVVEPAYEPAFDADYQPPVSSDYNGPAFDHEPVTSPIPVLRVEESVLPPSVPPWERTAPAARSADLYDLVPDQPADAHPAPTNVAPAAVEQQAPAPNRPLRARPLAETAYVRTELDFAATNYRGQPWHRTKPAAVVLAAAVIAAVLGGGWLVFRSPGTVAEQSSNEVSTSAPAAPSKAAPTAVSAPKPTPAAPQPPPPPPPPPPEPTYSAPQRQYQPRYSEPSPAQKPRVDVTRAPMSVAPEPKPVPGSNSGTPGDAPGEKPRRRGCFGFC